MKFIVTSTGRCGSKRLTQALKACGVLVKQEEFFNPYRTKFDKDDLEEYLSIDYSDVSGFSAPFLKDVPRGSGIKLVHLFREPVATVNSLITQGPRHPIEQGNIYGDFLLRYFPMPEGSEIHQLLEYWWFWNKLCMEHDLDVLTVWSESLDYEMGTGKHYYKRRLAQYLEVDPDRFIREWTCSDIHTNRTPTYRDLVRRKDLDWSDPKYDALFAVLQMRTLSPRPPKEAEEVLL